MSQSKTDLLQGTLDLVILKVLALEPLHGWGISQRIQQISKDVLQVNQGSLYPALHRLEQQAWIPLQRCGMNKIIRLKHRLPYARGSVAHYRTTSVSDRCLLFSP